MLCAITYFDCVISNTRSSIFRLIDELNLRKDHDITPKFLLNHFLFLFICFCLDLLKITQHLQTTRSNFTIFITDIKGKVIVMNISL